MLAVDLFGSALGAAVRVEDVTVRQHVEHHGQARCLVLPEFLSVG
jgi:hypothetical protein